VQHKHAAVPEHTSPAFEISEMRVNLSASSFCKWPGPRFYRDLDLIKMLDCRKVHLSATLARSIDIPL
jgi:hypothetical protein